MFKILWFIKFKNKMLEKCNISVFFLFYPPAIGANEQSKICIVRRGGNFFKQKKSLGPWCGITQLFWLWSDAYMTIMWGEKRLGLWQQGTKSRGTPGGVLTK